MLMKARKGTSVLVCIFLFINTHFLLPYVYLFTIIPSVAFKSGLKFSLRDKMKLPVIILVITAALSGLPAELRSEDAFQASISTLARPLAS